MTDATYFRDKAERCRELLSVASEPEVIQQLMQWVYEFEQQAAKLAEDSTDGNHE